MTEETIHLLQDIDMYRFFERGIRGGLTFTNVHQSKSHQSDTGNVHLVYIDQNNLYGSSLCKLLPHSEFTWLEGSDLEWFQNPDHILSLEDEGDFGYVLEVDLEYPSELHDSTADFPLAPESGLVTEEMFSPFMKDLLSKVQQQRGTNSGYKPCRKLLLTQYDKEKYICHFVILKFYLQMGLKLVRVHNVIKFRQKAFLEPYIKYNSMKRAQARNNF